MLMLFNLDQVTASLHELTHAPGVYSPGTDDNAYGYSASSALSSSAAILNADTYACTLKVGWPPLLTMYRANLV